MQTSIDRVNAAIHAFKNGKMVILTDHPDRENEGDLIMPAEVITPEMMNLMIRHGSGIVCLSMTEIDLQKLQLPLMVPANNNSSKRGTPFTISIDSRDGITTGVSAEDRVQTILDAVADHATPDDLVKPGHIFPLQANSDGVFGRQGHTEGALDLARIAGFKPAGVLCEIMNPDGTMARGQQLVEFAKAHDLPILSIDDIIIYRWTHENRIESQTATKIVLNDYGQFEIIAIREKGSLVEHLVLFKNKPTTQPTLVRIHSSCATGDIFASKRCDCHDQLHYSLQKISEEGGMLIYLNQEGRGIGLFNKIKAYSLQEKGFDTVEANVELGFPADARQYAIAANILREMNINDVRLLTNNPEKINDLMLYGISTVTREAMPVFHNEHNQDYLKTKKDKLNHHI